LGNHSDNSAKLSAVKKEITAAISMEIIRADPAKPATIPVTTNMPAPIIAPMFRIVASNNPKVGFSLDS